MKGIVAIAVYRCEVAGKPTDSNDVRVRYFESGTVAEIEQRLLGEPPESYANDRGETVSWPIARIMAMEAVENPTDGAEIVGFITGCEEPRQWVRP
jgi:hypothetical protein